MNTAYSPQPSVYLRAGTVLADFFCPFATDPAHNRADTQAPVLDLGDNIVGGRTRLGPSVDSLHRTGLAASVVVFSWGALLAFLSQVGDRWMFIPSERTELICVRLRQNIVRERLRAAFVTWLAMLVLGLVVCAVIALAATSADNPQTAQYGFAGAALVLASTWFGSNWSLLRRVRSLGEALFRTSVCFEYGYPQKTTILDVVSDGGRDEQLTRVRELFARFRDCDFAEWDQATLDGTSGAGGSAFGAGGSEVAKHILRAGTILGVVGLLARFVLVPGASWAAYRFRPAPPVAVTDIGCATNATSMNVWVGRSMNFRCPPCATPARLVGGPLYEISSSICSAAAHGGVIDATRGGSVRVLGSTPPPYAGNVAPYASSMSNRITSEMMFSGNNAFEVLPLPGAELAVSVAQMRAEQEAETRRLEAAAEARRAAAAEERRAAAAQAAEALRAANEMLAARAAQQALEAPPEPEVAAPVEETSTGSRHHRHRHD